MQFAWATITVKDMEESLVFYRDHLGLALKRRVSPAPGMELAFLDLGGSELELISDARNPSPTFGQDISLGFMVKSVEEMTAVLKSKGIPIHSGPFQPNAAIKFFFALDPNGLKIQFIERLGTEGQSSRT